MQTQKSNEKKSVQANAIVYWDRVKKTLETEKVYGDKALRLVYETAAGRIVADHFLAKPWLSQVYGLVQSSGISRRKIDEFVSQYQIPMSEFEKKSYKNFNEFFIRKFKNGARSFTRVQSEMPAFAEARYFAFDSIKTNQSFPVKGQFLSPDALLGSAEIAKPFIGGPLLLARLCPVDYHRFHFPDHGEILETYSVPGDYHSVNPMALKQRPEIFSTNERTVSILETKNFGKLAYIEVGAMCVGKIVQTHPEKKPFSRGDEKGYFLFGGSTVIVLGEPGKWVPADDLLEQTACRRETLVRLGDCVARAV